MVLIPRFLAWLVLIMAPACAMAHMVTAGMQRELNQHLTLDVRDDHLLLDYRVLMNEMAAFDEARAIDLDINGLLSEDELAAFKNEWSRRVRNGIEVWADGSNLDLQPLAPVELSMPLQKTWRLSARLPVDWPDGLELRLFNENYREYPGYSAIDVQVGNVRMPMIPLTDRRERELHLRLRRSAGLPLIEVIPTGNLTPKPVVSAMWPPPRPDTLKLSVISIVFGLLFSSFLAISLRYPTSRNLWLCAIMLILAVLGMWLPWRAELPWPGATRLQPPSPSEAIGIFENLHDTIYSAFDGRDESGTYDILAGAIEGELLESVFNEFYSGMLEAHDQHSQVSIRRIKRIKCRLEPSAASADAHFRVLCRWRVLGTVSHWGHAHSRQNQYDATYTVRWNGDAWRINHCDLSVNQRLPMT